MFLWFIQEVGGFFTERLIFAEGVLSTVIGFENLVVRCDLTSGKSAELTKHRKRTSVRFAWQAFKVVACHRPRILHHILR